MFKRLISSESGHTIAIPIAISIVACMAVRAMKIHGTWRLESVDTCLTIVALGAMGGVIILVLNVDERARTLNANLETIAQHIKKIEHNDRIRDTISEICAISREVSKDVRKLQDHDLEKMPEKSSFTCDAKMCAGLTPDIGLDSWLADEEGLDLWEYDKLS